QEEQRVDVFVPTEGEGEDERREDPWNGQRNHDTQHRLNSTRAVYQRTLLQLARYRLEITCQEPGAKRHQKGWVGEDQRPERVRQVGCTTQLDLVERSSFASYTPQPERDAHPEEQNAWEPIRQCPPV